MDTCGILGEHVLWLNTGDGTRRGACWLCGYHMQCINGNDEEFLSDVDDWAAFESQHLIWNLYLCGWLKLEDIDWCDMSPFISDRATTALVTRFDHPAVEDL